MATGRARGLGSPWWRSPVFEWGLLALVVALVVGLLWRQVRVVQGQAERAAVVSTLGALRTALVQDYLQNKVLGHRPSGVVTDGNPFVLLQAAPTYAGPASMGQMAEATPGSWVFDGVCRCIGYRPLYPEWLPAVPEPVALWFRVGTGPGPLEISAMADYVWQGQPVQ